MGRELNVLALIKGNERYVYVYDDDSRAALLEAFRAQAADPELSLNGFDAAVLAHSGNPRQRFGDVRVVDDAGRQIPYLV